MTNEELKKKWGPIYQSLIKHHPNVNVPEDEFVNLCEISRNRLYIDDSSKYYPPTELNRRIIGDPDGSDLSVILRLSWNFNEYDPDILFKYYNEFADSLPENWYIKYSFSDVIDRFIQKKKRKEKLSFLATL